ncbi:MAG: HDOD domain-containing protein [Methyloprofundus sp.]|nr:HDOD domain-containing protein [Methyloprofundus sp.]
MADTRVTLTAESLVQGSITLFSLPDIYHQIEKMVNDPRFTALEIGQVITKDPALSIRLLKLVNSSFYGFQSRIDTVSRAVAIIGIKDLQNLILATSVVDVFNDIPCDLVDMTDFWMQSVQCGVIAKLLAKESSVLHAERLFLAGLLHKIGALVLYQKLPELSAKVLKLADYNAELVPVIEQEMMGFTFADVGGELVKLWALPDSLHEAIAYQLNPEMALAHRLDAQILHIATVFCTALAYEQDSVNELWAKIPRERRSIISLDQGLLFSLLLQAEEDVRQFFELLVSGKKFY